jgi:1-aminocyclopropane-1-carboxylate deaminase/D-cysteine desulfhydrase-like pyridoxal-dependent ACC family enzyme
MSHESSSIIELFANCPALQACIPYMPLATLPTTIQDAPAFARQHGMASLHIKRDDQSGTLYGGNKTRKLGFLLTAARERGARSVITFGAAGSNHALATALYARECGMGAALILGPQHNSDHVRENIRAMYLSGATLCPCAWKDTVRTATSVFHRLWEQDGSTPYVIPPGGSSPAGTLGFVNAAYELKRQCDDGIVPEPDILYVASGTMGTCIGLALGLSAAGMNTKVMAIRVTTEPYTGMQRAKMLFGAVRALLTEGDATFARCNLCPSHFEIRDEFFGRDYALYTKEGIAAMDTAKEELGLSLEGTYTGKTFAGLLADASAGRLQDKHVLFWNTYNGGAPDGMEGEFDCRMLPVMLQEYFESKPQAQNFC